VWEVHDRAGEFRAIFGGGRYDRLLADVGGKAMPACGFGCGDVILGLLLEARGLRPEVESAAEYYVTTWRGEWAKVIKVVRHLRNRGKSAQIGLGIGSHKRDRKRGLAAGSRFVITVDDKDTQWPQVLVRDLQPEDAGRPTVARFDYRKLGG